MSAQEAIRIRPQGDIAVVEFDLPGEKVNKLSTPVMVRFKEVLGELKKSSYKAAVLVSRKPKIYIAGADIEEIKSITKPEDFRKAVQGGHEIFNLIEDLPIPVIAAIHGACMGGGCEMILACDYRVASDAPETRIGLPEVKLGIIPGFGGCVRLPRVTGLQASLDIILAGKAVNAKKAQKIGLVDDVIHPNLMEDFAIRKAQQVASQGKRKKVYQPRSFMDKFLESFLGQHLVFSQARKSVMKETRGHYPAPVKALEVVSRTYGMANRAEALSIEADGFVEVAATDVSKNLINVFFMMENVKKRPAVPGSNAAPKKVRAMGVLGAGTMGGGIAYIGADKGIDVRMKDINHGALARGFQAAHEIWGKLVKRKAITPQEMAQRLSRVSGGTDFSGFKKMDLVVEAIVEDMNIKKKVIGETAAQCRPDCIIATNTSSLSVSEMSKGHPNPAQFVGMHFFNPVHKMPLVEVIRGDQSSDEAVATVFELSKQLGKVPVVVKDGPGFLVNRLLLPYLSEAAFLLSDGMGVQEVDDMYLRYGMPMGPFHLMDEIGIDVCAKVLKIFKASFGERIETAPIIDKVVASGRMGRKNNKGFYIYDEKGKKGGVDHSIYTDLGLGAAKNELSEKECVERGVFAMVNEAALALLQDRIVESAEEVDLAMIMGTGFPPFRGGLLRYADSLGAEYICNQLEAYAQRYSPRFRPTAPLVALAKGQRKFYGA